MIIFGSACIGAGAAILFMLKMNSMNEPDNR